MKVLKTLWGLLVDDGRLAWTLVIGLVISAVVSMVLRLEFIGALIIWISLVAALIISVEHQLKLKVDRK
ncbi:hypothetical protein [Alicyclobacillus ferrooxydans]|uniref:Uncharacterized protein n=1 Tax=Alicyclobacillus ferrooxydans TaxID=471514 RepID=A0A0P9CRY3_9BACL|nr:hypothetical protein [Alicyclobacillus ferrooxydans]KPV42310.1 hypothetical protein AN477_18605 [Alicyclobacillus ferrooxydans]